jgi:hypothetical protein
VARGLGGRQRRHRGGGSKVAPAWRMGLAGDGAGGGL